ncbi:uncharacterized protein A1O9_03648 [Exophiala aquamarina CBS 119918]|uniref:Zn(2)-C6 fungal-type domain-containing protein n=1 Tax=Exophiala aquamarina CBS 119918 TaxID=1182545 RepID=A0A072PTJ1_9EURO|nr:uncharacterized protein A1O9_03648 [Exophiala aquamarina CBS 119918]KEF58805.1 hypothetical protein A1O9_03648 [Exophiala aquamarina CBS 119918]
MKKGRKAPRSRTGCKRCKERRFKCDEERPGCGRCQSAGLPCPGYNQSLKWSTKHEVFNPTKRRAQSFKSELQTPIPQGASIDIAGSLEAAQTDISPPLPILEDDNLHHFSVPLQSAPPDSEDAIYPNESFSTPAVPLDPFSTHIPDLQATPSGISFYSRPTDFDEATELEEADPSESLVPPVAIGMEFQPEQALVSSRQPLLPSPTRGPSDFSSALVEYYFKETAAVFSCYDGNMNPFRTTVGNFWTLSPALYRTLQSMAAACLVNENPYFKRLSRTLRTEAMSLLFNTPDEDETSLLALLMLGQSSSWFDPQDLGIPLFKTLRSRLNRREPTPDGQLTSVVGSHGFFQEAMEYWEMLLSFVSSEIISDPMDGPWSPSHSNMRKIPHPWTGICRETQMLVNQVGQLVRSERIRARSTKFTWQHSIDESVTSLQLARCLESRLRSLSEPQDEAIINPGDVETPIWHLQRIAEIYRRTGLINLYRVFPDLLLEQINQLQALNANSTMLSGTNSASDDWLGLVEDCTTGNTEPDSMYNWLTNYAIETIDLLESIPPTSRTRCLQPFMLVACACELRAPPLENPRPFDVTSTGLSTMNTDNFRWLSSPQLSFPNSISAFNTSFDDAQATGDPGLEVDESSLAQAFRVFHARRFVRGRLNLFMNVLPPRPTKTCMDLIEAVWNKLDEGNEDIYWIDVMMDMGLYTTMG